MLECACACLFHSCAKWYARAYPAVCDRMQHLVSVLCSHFARAFQKRPKARKEPLKLPSGIIYRLPLFGCSFLSSHCGVVLPSFCLFSCFFMFICRSCFGRRLLFPFFHSFSWFVTFLFQRPLRDFHTRGLHSLFGSEQPRTPHSTPHGHKCGASGHVGY